MAENLIDDDEFELDTVGMRWLEARRQKWMEQLVAQRVEEQVAQRTEERVVEVRQQEVRQEVQQEVERAARCRDILDVLRVRLGLDDAAEAVIAAALSTLTNEERLHALFLDALRVESLAAFQAALAEPRQS